MSERVRLANALPKRGGGFAIGGGTVKRGGSIFYGVDLPTGKVRFIDRKAFNGALESSDRVIRKEK